MQDAVAVGGQQASPQLVYFGTEYRPKDPSRLIIPLWAVAGLFFSLIAITFVGLGQGGQAKVYLAQRDRAVEGDDRRRVEPGQLVVQCDHLRPVRVRRGGGVGVDGVDRREYLITAGSVDREALADQVVALGDQRAVPAGTVLLVERDQLPIPHTGLTPGLDEHQQPEQTGHLRLVREQPAEDPRQPDGLGRELGANWVTVPSGEVALVEDEEQHRQHPAESFGQVGSLEVPKGAEVISTEGMSVLPGLWDMHFHQTGSEGILNLAAGVTSLDHGRPAAGFSGAGDARLLKRAGEGADHEDEPRPDRRGGSADPSPATTSR